MSSTHRVLALCALALLAMGGVAVMLATGDPAAQDRPIKGPRTSTTSPMDTEQAAKTIKRLAVGLTELKPDVCDSFSPSFLRSSNLSVERCKQDFAKGTPARVEYDQPTLYPETRKGEILVTNRETAERTTIKLKQDASGDWLITTVYSEDAEPKQPELPTTDAR